MRQLKIARKMALSKILFWLSLAVVIYTYIGYPLLLWLLVKLKSISIKEERPPFNTPLPEVTILIAAYNEELYVPIKMKSIEELKWPKERLKLIWVNDGSGDKTAELLKGYPQVRLLEMAKRGGKSAALNFAIPFIDSPIVLLTDANTLIDSEALTKIVEKFEDPLVGSVAGEKRIITSPEEGAAVAGEGLYWRYESAIKELDSKLYSTVGADGGLFAIRRDLLTPIPPDTLLDDFIISMEVVKKGYKIAYCKEAFAMEHASLSIEEEKKRKVRIAAGGVQASWRLRSLLNPFKRPLFAFQFLSHRVLRWSVTPIMLFMLLPLNLYLCAKESSFLYCMALFLQLLFYLIAIIGGLLREKKIAIKSFFIPYYFLFMNLNVIAGFNYLYKKERGEGIWEKAQRSGEKR